MAVACAFVPACLMAGGRRARGAVAETITIALEHFIGTELKHATFTVFHRCDILVLDQATQRTALFLDF